MMCNNPNHDLDNMNVYIKNCKILAICSQDIEWKRKSDTNQGPLLSYKFAKNDV